MAQESYDPTETELELRNIDRWREEIESFGHQVAGQLQEVLQQLEVSSRDSRRQPLPSRPVQEAMPPASDYVRRNPDPDNSQDRLANLKKLLAAKLSQSSTETVVDESS